MNRAVRTDIAQLGRQEVNDLHTVASAGGAGTGGKTLKTSSFSSTAKQQQQQAKDSLEEIKPIRQPGSKRRVIVINGFLLCLKIFNPRRFEFIKDFNEALKTIVFSKQTLAPLIIFSLSDP